VPLKMTPGQISAYTRIAHDLTDPADGSADVKVYSVNRTWSALKLVIPMKDRKSLTTSRL